MALTLSNAARLKPEIRLAQAVSEFESILSGPQKAEFRGWRAQALKRPPDTTDVMRFTADVDRRIAKGNRCLGPRFTSFLSAVQQFAALGDVVVGGSQNIIACGVWSLVRMSILVRTCFFDRTMAWTPIYSSPLLDRIAQAKQWPTYLLHSQATLQQRLTFAKS
jgi:hypothetical protein